MEFLFYCRDKPETGPLLQRFVEAHWSFMDGYADRLRVRGPTLSDDGEQHTGSLHIVRLDSVAETDTFAYQEPFYQAGCYEAVTIRRWQDRLGRTLRDFKPQGEAPLFLLRGEMPDGAQPPDLPEGHRACCAAFGWTGPLDGTAWTGFAAVLQAPTRADVDALRGEFPAAHIVIDRWCIGGRR